jgi:PadR family transcriptional regulator, regulatory protein PadR
MYIVLQYINKLEVISLDKELMKGSIDILLLSEVGTTDKYGYEIVQSLKHKSKDTYQMSEGTLYPALKRLERKGFVSSYWGDSDGGGRRKYYRITDQGRAQLANQINEWQQVNLLIQICTGGV